jgi:hypothetical protein
MQSAFLTIVALIVVAHVVVAGALATLRPPSVPLIVSDPYVSVWSNSDALTDSWPTHWSGAITAFTGLIRIDGTAFRFAGPSDLGAPAMTQTSVVVTATRTNYTFVQQGVQLNVIFTTPAMLGATGAVEDDFDLISRGVTYVDVQMTSVDSNTHKVSLYMDMTSELVVNDVSTNVVWNRVANLPSGLVSMRIGSEKQPVLQQSGDGIRISWGYLHLTSNVNDSPLMSAMAGSVKARMSFMQTARLPSDDMNMPRACSDDWPVLAFASKELTLAPGATESRWIMVHVDDQYSINYFGTYLRSYATAKYGGIENNIVVSAQQHVDLVQHAAQFDQHVYATLQQVGGEAYAQLGSLVYRQVTGATKLTVDDQGVIRHFMKEISSDGDLQTVDVIYPASPFFLYFAPSLLAYQLVPIFEYALNMTGDKYPFAFAPHHLGFYPIGDIQPSQQENMPVEETGNMILMLAGIVKQMKGSTALLDKLLPPGSWDLVHSWALYLQANTLDTENQLCTDDFEGPSAHNSNLAAKGMAALGAYAYMLDAKGQHADAQTFYAIARNYAAQWKTFALDPQSTLTTTHYKLQYDKPASWSLKYNLVWDLLLSTNVFSKDVFDAELAYYLGQQRTAYGLPLDVRSDYAKFDWTSWVAAMSPDSSVFSSVMADLWQYAHVTSSRVPLSDWYYAHTATSVGFRARSVVGGIYMKMLF